ncbi:MAG: aminotransferase class V-fold PLP-dependent enzyme [Clostridia bacterium]|nr:aminotransferase class V-fold PLP-dependent enzyme [Clostridia bacterium]
MIYLDNAATTFPKPACVAQDVAACLRGFGVNPGRGGYRLSARAGEAVFETRALLAALFEGTPERVIWTKNCTEAINIVLKGTLQPGDHVIISSLEHNAVLRPLERLRQENGVQYDVADVCPADPGQTVENFAALIRPGTRLIFCTQVSNVFGTVLPVRALGALAAQHGLRFGVDAAQGAGTEPISLRRDGVDYLCVPGHKGLFGPMGTGALLLGKDVDVLPLTEGGTGSFSLSADQPQDYPDRLESGTLNLPGIVGLRAGLRCLRRVGMDAVRQHEQTLVRLLKEDLSVIPNVRLFDAMHTNGAGTLLSLTVGNAHSEQTAALLDDSGFAVRAGYHCAMLAHTRHGTADAGTVRVSPGVFNTVPQIKNFIFCLNKIALGRKVC